MEDFKRLTIDSYNKAASGYNAEKQMHFWVDEFAAYKKLIPGKKVIDIGCGAGRDAVVFTEEDFEYTGTDASEGMLKIAAERASKGVYAVMEFTHLDFPDNTFDGFWSAAAWLHVPKNEVAKAIAEAERVIKSSGVGFVSLKERNGISERFIEEKNRWGGIARYFAFYEQDEFAQYLRDAGFEILETSKHIEDDERKTSWLCYFVKKP